MKKTGIIIIAFLSVAFFVFLVRYGFTHTRGIPVPIEETRRPVVEVPFVDKEIDLTRGIDMDFWAGRPAHEIKLFYQVMVLPWPKIVTPAVTVKAFRNSRDIYFYMDWRDETEDSTLGINRFPDGCAVMFTLEDKAETPTLMMGFLGRANIWHWKASRDREYWSRISPGDEKVYVDHYYPFEDEEVLSVSKEKVRSAVNDLIAIRVGTVSPKERQDVEGRGVYSDGVWRVVFVRALNIIDAEQDAEFSPGKKLSAFAVWNGSKGDRGGRKSISDWVELVIE